MDDGIKVELGGIRGSLGLDDNGDQIYQVHLGGDIPGLYAQETWGVDG